jgi:hypothetical protein
MSLFDGSSLRVSLGDGPPVDAFFEAPTVMRREPCWNKRLEGQGPARRISRCSNTSMLWSNVRSLVHKNDRQESAQEFR